MLASRDAVSVSVPAALGCAFVVALLARGFGTFRASRADWLEPVPTLLIGAWMCFRQWGQPNLKSSSGFLY